MWNVATLNLDKKANIPHYSQGRFTESILLNWIGNYTDKSIVSGNILTFVIKRLFQTISNEYKYAYKKSEKFHETCVLLCLGFSEKEEISLQKINYFFNKISFQKIILHIKSS